MLTQEEMATINTVDLTFDDASLLTMDTALLERPTPSGRAAGDRTDGGNGAENVLMPVEEASIKGDNLTMEGHPTSTPALPENPTAKATSNESYAAANDGQVQEKLNEVQVHAAKGSISAASTERSSHLGDFTTPAVTVPAPATLEGDGEKHQVGISNPNLLSNDNDQGDDDSNAQTILPSLASKEVEANVQASKMMSFPKPTSPTKLAQSGGFSITPSMAGDALSSENASTLLRVMQVPTLLSEGFQSSDHSSGSSPPDKKGFKGLDQEDPNSSYPIDLVVTTSHPDENPEEEGEDKEDEEEGTPTPYGDFENGATDNDSFDRSLNSDLITSKEEDGKVSGSIPLTVSHKCLQGDLSKTYLNDGLLTAESHLSNENLEEAPDWHIAEHFRTALLALTATALASFFIGKLVSNLQAEKFIVQHKDHCNDSNFDEIMVDLQNERRNLADCAAHFDEIMAELQNEKRNLADCAAHVDEIMADLQNEERILAHSETHFDETMAGAGAGSENFHGWSMASTLLVISVVFFLVFGVADVVTRKRSEEAKLKQERLNQQLQEAKQARLNAERQKEKVEKECQQLVQAMDEFAEKRFGQHLQEVKQVRLNAERQKKKAEKECQQLVQAMDEFAEKRFGQQLQEAKQARLDAVREKEKVEKDFQQLQLATAEAKLRVDQQLQEAKQATVDAKREKEKVEKDFQQLQLAKDNAERLEKQRLENAGQEKQNLNEERQELDLQRQELEKAGLEAEQRMEAIRMEEEKLEQRQKEERLKLAEANLLEAEEVYLRALRDNATGDFCEEAHAILLAAEHELIQAAVDLGDGDRVRVEERLVERIEQERLRKAATFAEESARQEAVERSRREAEEARQAQEESR